MPTYEYLCQTCSHRFETWQKMTDEPLTVCPECGNHIRRVLYPAGIVFKGSGFYVTDHNKSSKSGQASSSDHHDNHSNGKSESSTESKSGGESKPAEKSSSASSTTTPSTTTSTTSATTN